MRQSEVEGHRAAIRPAEQVELLHTQSVEGALERLRLELDGVIVRQGSPRRPRSTLRSCALITRLSRDQCSACGSKVNQPARAPDTSTRGSPSPVTSSFMDNGRLPSAVRMIRLLALDFRARMRRASRRALIHFPATGTSGMYEFDALTLDV